MFRSLAILHSCVLTVIVLCGSIQLAAQDNAENSEPNRLFTLEVLPVLNEKCFACHGTDEAKRKGDFDATSRQALLRGGESGEPAIVPHDAESSLLLSAVEWDDLEMPPKENDRLTPSQIDSIRKWIEAGAPWPSDAEQDKIRKQAWQSEGTEGEQVPTSGGLNAQWTDRRYSRQDLWAFRPVEQPIPPVQDATSAHPVDAFINLRLTQQSIRPAPLATPSELIRRASFDLLGLPPAPQEIKEFEEAWKKDAKSAWENLIDRLLRSPHYGERWAQHWLDVVRYADTSGFSNDWERSNAWRYRDYVIRAFNEDKPYNEFVVEQIAGDELDPQNPEMKVATSFLRMGPWEHTAMSPNQVSRQSYLDDVVNSVGQTFLSTAMRCCKCHDHKFDPIPTRDYYRMYAAFSATQPAEVPADFLSSENKTDFAEEKAHVQRLLEFAKQERDQIYSKREEAAKKWYAEKGIAENYKPFHQRIRLPQGELKPPRFVGLSTQEEGVLKVREQDVWIWERRLERFQPMAQSVYNGGNLYQHSKRLRPPKNKAEKERCQKLPESFILMGGDVFSQADAVEPGVLSAIQLRTVSATKTDPYRLPSTQDQRRLALARWIANEKNPLTTRSIVNRLWQYHFGSGIAGNPNNFGATGKQPTHPKLLDWLASELVKRNWSMKDMHRLIMTSQAYQRSTHHPDSKALLSIDPNNELRAVFVPRRLSAEEIRDAMLTATGELNLQLGGIPARPEINREVAFAPRMIQFSLAPAYQPNRTPEQRNRRSIYAYRIRGLADPLMEVMNKPTSDESCELRDSYETSPQAFTLLNSDFVTKRSVAMANRLRKQTADLESQIRLGYQLTVGKPPSDKAIARLTMHYHKMVAYHQENEPAPENYPSFLERSVVEEMSGESCSYRERLDIFENYVPDLQPSDVDAQTRAMADLCLLMFNLSDFMYVY